MSVTTKSPSDAPAQAEAPQRKRASVPRWLIVALIAAPTLLILLIMSGVLSGIGRGGSLISFPQILSATTPTGGDMGAHVLLPKILRESLLPSGQIFGWSQDWYAGFPALYFYFPLPALATVALDLVIPYGVAFKLVSIAGLVALPVASYLFVRLLGFARIVSAIAGLAGGVFVFMESFSIFGANMKSTLAGEFSFSWSFALSLIYLGLVARDTREGRRFSPLAGVVLALTALSHIVTTMVVVIVSLPLLLRRGGSRQLGSSWGLGFAVAAFWALPFAIRVLGGMTTDMGWFPVQNIVGDTNPGSPFPGEFIPIFVVGVIGLIWTSLRRDDVVVLLWLTIVPLVGYLVIARLDFTILYNARLLPYWYYGMFVFAGLALGLAVVELARRFPQRGRNVIAGAVVVGLLLLVATAVAIHDVPGWARWNYEGYEGKEVWPEYDALMQTVDGLPPGRIMWEANSEMNKYGTPMALMLFPYWSEGHPSQEGLFFETSLTTPFHFLNAAEVSLRPSNPVRGLNYHVGINFERAEDHLGVYAVRYYVAYTPEATEQAVEHGWPVIGEAPPWTIFELPPSDLVDVGRFEPAVWDGEADIVDASLEWYDDTVNLDKWLVASGPDDWRRVDAVDDRLSGLVPLRAGGEVSDVVVEDNRISFRTTAVGVPHLVKVSYFPNWEATGADGPYRAAPSLMIVVPTEQDVTLEFSNTSVENMGMVLTIAALLGLGGWFWWRRRRQHESAVPEEAA